MRSVLLGAARRDTGAGGGGGHAHAQADRNTLNVDYHVARYTQIIAELEARVGKLQQELAAERSQQRCVGVTAWSCGLGWGWRKATQIACALSAAHATMGSGAKHSTMAGSSGAALP